MSSPRCFPLGPGAVGKMGGVIRGRIDRQHHRQRPHRKGSMVLTNGTRIALKLEGPSDRPQSVVQAAQDAYYEEFGVWPYVQGMPNVATETPEPEPEPEPEAIKKSKTRR